MNGAIIATWGTPVRGREAKALEVFGKVLAHYDDLAKQGRIHSHREYFSLTGNASKWGGMQIVEGETEELLKLQMEESTRRLTAEAQQIVENFTVQICVGGSERSIADEMTMYAETLKALGYL
ncbi:MAG: hypothetical protein WDA27_13595 [Actinomycetota bacterium]